MVTYSKPDWKNCQVKEMDNGASELTTSGGSVLNGVKEMQNGFKSVIIIE